MSKTVDQILRKVGAQKMEASLQGTTTQQLQTLRQICKEQGIAFPTEDKEPQQAYALGTRKKIKTYQRQETNLDPSQYVVQDGFLRNADETEAQQINTVRPQATGYCIMTAEQASSWTSANKTMSSDELALIVLGPLIGPTTLQTQSVEVPVRDKHERESLIAATVVQLGEKHIKTRLERDAAVPTKPTTVIAWTAWKDEYTEEAWQRLTRNPVECLQTSLKENGQEEMPSTWGRSYRNGTAPCTQDSATSVQLHSSVQTDRLEGLLMKSGFQGWYPTPKAKEGRAMQEWRVIWLTESKAEIIRCSTEINHAGLVRNDKTYGIRVAADKFDHAWKQLHPNKEPPSSVRTQYLYKLEPLPWGTTKEMLEKWGEAQKWGLRPIKQLGGRAWLIGTEQQKPQGILAFNTQALIATLLPPKNAKPERQILAGARRPLGMPDKQKDTQPNDPWLSNNPQRAGAQTPAQPRQIDGPVETKFKETDEKVAKLESAMKELQ